jgi:hypothetical protein
VLLPCRSMAQLLPRKRQSLVLRDSSCVAEEICNQSMIGKHGGGLGSVCNV